MFQVIFGLMFKLFNFKYLFLYFSWLSDFCDSFGPRSERSERGGTLAVSSRESSGIFFPSPSSYFVRQKNFKRYILQNTQSRTAFSVIYFVCFYILHEAGLWAWHSGFCALPLFLDQKYRCP